MTSLAKRAEAPPEQAAAARLRPVAAVPRPVVPTTAEVAECTCPEFCERDHEVD